MKKKYERLATVGTWIWFVGMLEFDSSVVAAVVMTLGGLSLTIYAVKRLEALDERRRN